MALAVDHEAVRQQRLVRCAAVDGAAGEQRALEPAAMLVGAFEIEVGRVGELGLMRTAQDARMRHAGIEPDVERVAHLAVLGGLVTEQFAASSENQASMPACSTRRATSSISSAVRGCSAAGFPVQEEGDRHAPVALARDAPVGAGLHHRFKSGTTPGREELRFIDGAFGDPAQRGGVFPVLVLHADEPLRGGAEDDRRLVPPAVRVAVLIRSILSSRPLTSSSCSTSGLASQTVLPASSPRPRGRACWRGTGRRRRPGY